jgi:hypothetical protein
MPSSPEFQHWLPPHVYNAIPFGKTMLGDAPSICPPREAATK